MVTDMYAHYVLRVAREHKVKENKELEAYLCHLLNIRPDRLYELLSFPLEEMYEEIRKEMDNE